MNAPIAMILSILEIKPTAQTKVAKNLLSLSLRELKVRSPAKRARTKVGHVGRMKLLFAAITSRQERPEIRSTVRTKTITRFNTKSAFGAHRKPPFGEQWGHSLCRLSFLWNQFRNLCIGLFGDRFEDPHRLAFSMKNERDPCFGHTQIAGDPPLGQIMLPHDALYFFGHWF